MSYKSESANCMWRAGAKRCWRSRVWCGCRQPGAAKRARRSAVAVLCRRVGRLPGDDYIALPLLADSPRGGHWVTTEGRLLAPKLTCLF